MLNEISIETFKGNKDAYYAFKRSIQDSKKTLTLATIAAGAGVARELADKALAELAMIIFVD